MNSTILIGQYVEAPSLLHRLDPRTKIISIIMLMAGFLLLDTFIGYMASTIIVLVVLRLSQIPFSVFGRGLQPLLLILLFTFVYNALFTEGRIIWSWSIVQVTEEGLLSGLYYVWRIILLVLLSSVLTLTTKPLKLAQGLESLLSPLAKIHLPVEQFSLMIVIAIRFIPTFAEELDRILLAQKARGFDLTDLPLHKRISAYIPILVPLLFTVIQRAEQLSYAIDARAYGKGKGRTVYKQLVFKFVDYQAGGVVVVITAALLLLKAGGI